MPFRFVRTTPSSSRRQRACVSDVLSTRASRMSGQTRPVARPALARRPCRALSAARLRASASASPPGRPLVILPGLGNSAADYASLAASLRSRGWTVSVAPVSRADWLRNAAGVVDPAYWAGTLNPRPTVDWFLGHIDTAAAEARSAAGAEPLTLVAHSAGGWLARVWLARHGLAGVACLATLGSPLRPPPSGVPGLIDQTRGILAFVEANCPGPAQLVAAGGRAVCVAGRAVRGDAARLSLATLPAWAVGQGYRQVCGVADCWGDGITPVETALADGALHIVLDGVFHSPLGESPERPWYGSEAVLDRWVHALDGSPEPLVTPGAAEAAAAL